MRELFLQTNSYTILVYSGCYSKNTIDWVACKQQKFVSHGPGGMKSEIRCQHGRVRAFLWSQTSPCICTQQKGVGSSVGSLL